jgi:hypothetical protein
MPTPILATVVVVVVVVELVTAIHRVEEDMQLLLTVKATVVGRPVEPRTVHLEDKIMAHNTVPMEVAPKTIIR